MEHDQPPDEAVNQAEAGPADKTRKLDSRVWLLVAAGVALVALVAAAAYASRGGRTGGGSSGAALSAEATGTGGVSQGSTGTIEGSGDRSQVATGTQGSSADGASQGGTSQGTSPGGPVEQKIAPEGSQLTTLSAPPPKTLGLLKLPEGFTSASFRYTFSPYGWGQGGQEGGRLVVKIEKAEPLTGDADKFKDYSGYNASLWVVPTLTSRIELGGSYTGTVNVKQQGDVGVLWLTELEAE